MKNGNKNKVRSLSDKDFVIIENSSIVSKILEERFEHWGYLMYSQVISQLICFTLTNQEKISLN